MARPRGWKISRRALADLLIIRQMTRGELAAAAEISPQMLGDLAGVKRAGASMRTARLLAEALSVDVATLFPEADGFQVATREVAA